MDLVFHVSNFVGGSFFSDKFKVLPEHWECEAVFLILLLEVGLRWLQLNVAPSVPRPASLPRSFRLPCPPLGTRSGDPLAGVIGHESGLSGRVN